MEEEHKRFPSFACKDIGIDCMPDFVTKSASPGNVDMSSVPEEIM